MKCHLNYIVTKIWSVTQIGFDSNWNVIQNEFSLKMECHSKWNITKNEMSLKLMIT